MRIQDSSLILELAGRSRAGGKLDKQPGDDMPPGLLPQGQV
jgi:hypothetical protein